MTHYTNSANLETLVHVSSMVIRWCIVLNWHMRTICNMYTCLGLLTLQDRLFVLKDNFCQFLISALMFSFLYSYFLGMEKFLIILSQIPRNLFLTYLVFKLDILHRCGSFLPDLKSCHSNDVTYLLRVSVEYLNFLLLVNPLHPTISMHILHTVLYTSPKELTRRIFLTIKRFLVGDHFLYSHDLHVWFRGDVIGRN